MEYVQGQPRDQLYLIPTSLDEVLDPDHEVRLLDQFVESLDTEAMGFRHARLSQPKGGRPAFHPRILLKLYLYGYLNRVRSSRALERECRRNIELMWLVQGLAPDHNTISNFRRDNATAIREVFRATVLTARNFQLIGSRMLATDSTRLRAQNSRKNNFSESKIRRHLERIEQAEAAYGKVISGEEPGDFTQAVLARRALQRQKRRYRQLQSRLSRSGQRQLSTSDPDSRLMVTRHNQIEVAYNVQATVDGDNKLLVDYLVTNQKDDRALGLMAERATEELSTNRMTMLFDKGYHSGAELEKAAALGVEVLVAVPEAAAQAPDPAYNLEAFRYNPRKHTYTCPQGHELRTNGRWYAKQSGQQTIDVQHFKTPQCLTCPVRHRCTRQPKGRVIERSRFAPLVEANKRRIKARPDDYKLRSQIVEHPFGTMKRQWGFDHIMTKRFLSRASADVGLMFTAYNLRRLFHLVGKYLPRGLNGGPSGGWRGLQGRMERFRGLVWKLLAEMEAELSFGDRTSYVAW